MSLRPNGTYRCDRCGVDVGNGSATTCTVVVMLDEVDAGGVLVETPVTGHFCRTPREDFPNGCTGRVLTAANLADYTASKGADAP